MSLCGLCATTGKTCCQQTDILLTVGDLDRLQAHLGGARFYEYRHPRDPGCLGDEEDPNWLAYTLRPDGTRRVLRQAPGGDCLFLSPSGCGLTQEVRPLICRLHPITYTEAQITGVSPECPVHLSGPGAPLLEAIGMDLETARRCHRQLYAELRREIPPLGRAA